MYFVYCIIGLKEYNIGKKVLKDIKFCILLIYL